MVDAGKVGEVGAGPGGKRARGKKEGEDDEKEEEEKEDEGEEEGERHMGIIRYR